MADPVVSPSDLALYLKDGTIDDARATLLISDAQQQCANFLGLGDDDEFPANCSSIVARIAYLAYVSIVPAKNGQLRAAGAGIGGGPPAPWTGVRLTQQDEKDLERAARGSSGSAAAFTIDMLPAAAGSGLPWWDTGSPVLTGDWDTIPS